MRISTNIVIILLIFCSLLIPGISRSQPFSATELDAAEVHYREGDYSAAIAVYEGIIQQGWTNGPIYYNLGNCYYKIGQYGRAILNYERALQLLGNDSDLLANLKLANLRIYDRIEPLPRFFVIRLIEGIGILLPVRRWALLFLFVEWVLLACLISLHVVRKPNWRRLFVGGLVIAGVLSVLSCGFFLQQKVQKDNQKQGIVLAEKVEVRSAPESGSTELFSLHEGVKIKILRQVSDWTEIRLADGKQGWLPQSAFEVI